MALSNPPPTYPLTGIYPDGYIRFVESTFAVIAEPNRRAILSMLSSSERSVGELMHRLRLRQPSVSKHLKVLRDSGFVESRVEAQRRVYRLNPKPLQEVDAWLEPFRRFWSKHVDALEKHLDKMGKVPSVKGKKSHEQPRRSTKSTTASGKSSKGFTAEERAAMKERTQELKAASRRGSRANKADGESDVLAKIAEMPERDRALAERLHAIVKASAPALSPRTWYGMPAYAKDDDVVCFFQSAEKFKARYATFGFSDKANLDEGHMWPTAFALKELTAAAEAKIGALVKKAVS